MNMNRQALISSPALGFSIVELMVAMTIGLVILLATTTIFVQSKSSHTTQDSLARLQENARFAMQFMMRDLRMAGYFGCADEVTSVKNVLVGALAGEAFDVSNPLQGSENKSDWYPLHAPPNGIAPPTNMHAGTDAFTLRYLDMENSVAVEAPFAVTPTGALKVKNNSGLQKGDLVMVTDCSSSALFQITGPDDIAGTGDIEHVSPGPGPGNNPADIGKIYEGDAQIAKYRYASYFIADGASTQPSLFRSTLVRDSTSGAVTVTPQELVEGIENLQILYGEDTSGDRVPDKYVKANAVANWRNVVALRVGILARSLAQTERGSKEHGTDIDTQQYDIDGDGSTDFTAPGDHYERRVFRTTVLMRNLQ